MIIQTDIWSLSAVTLAALLAGAVLSWGWLRRRQRRATPREQKERDILYLVFSRMGHHLKTATEVIRGHLQAVGDDPPQGDGRWKSARRAISDETAGIGALIERLDLIVRLGMTEQPLVIEPVNVPRLLEDLMLDIGPAADARGILLGGIVQAGQADANYVSGDASALREVFSNLIENAVKHNGRGTEIAAEVKKQDDRLAVRIRDTGKGIKPDVLSDLFEKVRPDYRPKMTKGTGMGLYLCRLLVELHGGQISASAIEGKGTEFLVLLPLRRTA